MKLGHRRNYHEGWAALRHYANQPARPLGAVHIQYITSAGRVSPNADKRLLKGPRGLLRDCATSPMNR